MTQYSLWEYCCVYIQQNTNDKILQSLLNRETNKNPYLRYWRKFSVLIQYVFPLFYYPNFVDLCCHCFLPKSVYARIFALFWSFILSLMNLLKCASVGRMIFLSWFAGPGASEIYIVCSLSCGCSGYLRCFGPHGAGRGVLFWLLVGRVTSLPC